MVPTIPSQQLGLKEPLKLGSIGVLKTSQLVETLLNELHPTEPVGAYSTESDGLTTYYQPLLSTGYSCVE